MNLKHRDIESLARFVLKFLHKKGLPELLAKEAMAVQAVQHLFEKNFAEESEINAQAQKLFEANRRKIASNMDEEKAVAMIKKQIAKEKGFVL